MKYLADTHTHSIYSYDGQMKMEDMIKKALALGLEYLAFTEHLELGQITIKQFLNRYKLYSEEIDNLQTRYPNIRLIKGIEFSNPELYPKELEIVNNLDLDYIIGSNHLLPKDNSEKEILLYYKRILEIIKQGGIDTIAHLDYLRRKYDDSTISQDIIKEIFCTLIKKDIALEINTSAIRRRQLDSFPSKEKLKIYQSLGGTKVTIGSDAHRLNEIYDSIPQIDSDYDFEKGLYLKRRFISLSQK